jgi:hypothetical protein
MGLASRRDFKDTAKGVNLPQKTGSMLSPNGRLLGNVTTYGVVTYAVRASLGGLAIDTYVQGF